MQLNEIVQQPEQQSMVAYVVWQIFIAERDAFKVKVFFITIDARDVVEQWITKRFGPKPF